MTAQHVLVVEDNTMNVDLLRENLEEAGYVFSLAVNGAAGVALANEQLPDLVLMDVHLPILDGLSATRLLKRHTLTQGIPIIALTARAMAGDREACMAAGCDDYISKPVDMALLLAKMKLHLDRRPQAFVDMIRRRRNKAEPEPGQDSPARAQPGMAARDYEEELRSLNSTLRRLEAELGQARGQLQSLSAERDRLTYELGLAQSQIDTLEQQLGEAPREEQGDGLRKENERLREALLEVHRSLSEVTDSARDLAFPSR